MKLFHTDFSTISSIFQTLRKSYLLALNLVHSFDLNETYMIIFSDSL